MASAGEQEIDAALSGDKEYFILVQKAYKARVLIVDGEDNSVSATAPPRIKPRASIPATRSPRRRKPVAST